jgi:hypothetical protein
MNSLLSVVRGWSSGIISYMPRTEVWKEQEETEWLSAMIPTDRDAAERGCRRGKDLTEHLERVRATPDLESFEGLLVLGDSLILEQRDVINFGHLDVQVEIDENAQCRVTADGKSIHVGPCLPGVEVGSASGSLDLLCSALSASKVRSVTVYRSDELVAVFFGGAHEGNEDMQQRLIQWGTMRAVSQSATEEMRNYMESVLAWNGVAEIVADMRSILPEVSEGVYAAIAFPNVSEVQRASVVSAMREDGLLPILNWDRSLVNGVALLSLSFSLRLRRPQIAEFLEGHGLNLEQTLEAVETCNKKHGTPEIWDAGNILLSSV